MFHLYIDMSLLLHPEEVQRQLAQLICLNGMQTCPDTPGTEKTVCAFVETSWLKDKPPPISCADVGIDPKNIAPNSFFFVKGWNRSVCAMAVMYAIYSEPDLLQARPVSLGLCVVPSPKPSLLRISSSGPQAVPAEIMQCLGLFFF